MLGLSVQSPFASSPADDRGAVDRALAEAGTVSGAYARSPYGFRRLGPAAEALVRPLGADGGAWVLVSMRGSGEEGHRSHLRERCLTAAQRFMLALACEGVDNTWVDAAVPDAAAFRAAGVDLGPEDPVGLVWCAHG